MTGHPTPRSITLGLACLAMGSTTAAAAATVGSSTSPDFSARCSAIGASAGDNGNGYNGTKLTAARFHPDGAEVSLLTQPGAPPAKMALPAHCEIEGLLHQRRGIDGQSYAIRFRLRLPEAWNGRFLFQGGGGTNGSVGDAIGQVGAGRTNALARGFAVLAQDSGHDNATNSDPAHGGEAAFARDPQARADYGGQSLRPVTLAARALVRQFYGKMPRYSYFYGCSKGGQEGMMLAQRNPELYDGIVAAAPGLSLPRAALAEAWNTASFANVLKAQGRAVTLANLASAFSPAEGNLVRGAVLAACDADDGAVDGMVGAFRQCTSAKVLPRLKAAQCIADKPGACLSPAQITALLRIHDGLRDRAGHNIYPGFPWDAGWFDPGWSIWITGSADGKIPALNVMLGAPSRAVIFSSPPRVIDPSPPAMLAFQAGFNADRDSHFIHDRAVGWPRSAWQDIAARSPDLARFRARGGRLIVPQGVSDPVFSINDTIAWWNAVNRANHGTADRFTRVFPVPGMGHCAGGPATDSFDAFEAIQAWVERGKAPELLHARAGASSPWPGRERPLCRIPLEPRADGAQGWHCVRPG